MNTYYSNNKEKLKENVARYKKRMQNTHIHTSRDGIITLFYKVDAVDDIQLRKDILREIKKHINREAIVIVDNHTVQIMFLAKNIFNANEIFSNMELFIYKKNEEHLKNKEMECIQ